MWITKAGRVKESDGCDAQGYEAKERGWEILGITEGIIFYKLYSPSTSQMEF